MDKKAVEEKRKDKLPYQYNKGIFKDFNPEEMVQNTGCEYLKEKQELVVTLMGKNYIVKYPSGEVLNEDYSEIKKYPMKTLILRYLMNAKGVPPTNKDITYREVSGGNVYYNNFYGRCMLRLSKTFGEKLNKLSEIFERLGAKKVKIGDVGYKFEFINNIYVTFALWGGDDEFPASSQILFDENVQYYFTAEDLAVVGDVSIGILTKMAF
ncbi:DUF3786 domain-containing protein [Haloimpatiens sp. FM7330]|uniref:DUF3786 domain-containing protein n=1 Tax=Haloimpatiens sp. FM7330 TaxID=3298610 RepID=UPI0036284238